jgi:hypothetical protein
LATFLGQHWMNVKWILQREKYNCTWGMSNVERETSLK